MPEVQAKEFRLWSFGLVPHKLMLLESVATIPHYNLSYKISRISEV